MSDAEIDAFAVEVLFSTVTNVNFDAHRLFTLVQKLADMRDRARAIYEKAYLQKKCGRRTRKLPARPPGLLRLTSAKQYVRGEEFSISARQNTLGEDVTALQELIIYGLKGMAAYADHAMILGQQDDAVFAFIHQALDFFNL